MSDPAAEQNTSADATNAAPGAVTGLFRSLTNLAATFVAVAQTRLELLTTELQEEVHHTVDLAIWALVALLAAMIGLFFGGITIVLVYWDTHRVLAAVLVTAALFVFAVVAVAVLLAKLKGRPRFLDATRAELAKDANSLKARL